MFSETFTICCSYLKIIYSVFSLTGPLASILTNKYGCRITTIAGAIIAAAGFVLSLFAPNLYFLYFSFGIMSGKFLVLSSAVYENVIKRRIIDNYVIKRCIKKYFLNFVEKKKGYNYIF